jgi:hypothetical protein
MKVDNNYNSKISKFIGPQSTQKSYSLCKLYDEELKVKEGKPVVSQQVLEQEKSRKFNFMMSKLF